jgi:hypothetical protein
MLVPHHIYMQSILSWSVCGLDVVFDVDEFLCYREKKEDERARSGEIEDGGKTNFGHLLQARIEE